MELCDPMSGATQHPLLAVLGPTASGKSAVAEFLAERLDGELVNSDASAMYTELSVGVTKPTAESRHRHVYHLLDVAALETPLSVVDFQQKAFEVVRDIARRGKVPILVGGSSLYVRSLLEGYRPSEIFVDSALREKVRAMPPADALEELERRDPQTWSRIDRKNPRRVTRALELTMASGAPVPPSQKRPPEDFRILRHLLCPTLELLRMRVEERTRGMWPAWREEVLALEKNGLAHWLEARKPIGYQVVRSHLRGDLDEMEAIEQIVSSTVALAKKQRTWLKKDLEGPDRYRWMLDRIEDWEDLPRRVLEVSEGFLTRFRT